MLLSMTGYGAGQADHDGVSVAVEVRSVNNRYLKLHTRLPDGYIALEPRIEELVRTYVRRGAVQLNVDVLRKASPDDFRIDADVLSGYVHQVAAFRESSNESTKPYLDVALGPLLQLPGVISDLKRRSVDVDADWPLIRDALESALKDLRTMRESEGRVMEKDLIEQADDIRARSAEISKLAPTVVEAYQKRLTERLNKLLEQHDLQVGATDVVREVGVFAERADISEEIVRLGSHLDQFAAIMKEKEGAGRKLEFLVQELLRETNTIGSKANNSDIAKHVVHVKTCIERIREMVQNVE